MSQSSVPGQSIVSCRTFRSGLFSADLTPFVHAGWAVVDLTDNPLHDRSDVSRRIVHFCTRLLEPIHGKTA
jgi:hypothetical protein